MYLSSAQQCSWPNSRTPTNPNNGPVDLVNAARINAQADRAAAGWTPLYTRDWRDFAELGAPVAFQVMNAPVGLNPSNPTVALGPTSPNSPTDNSGGAPVGVMTGGPGSTPGGSGGGSGTGSTVVNVGPGGGGVAPTTGPCGPIVLQGAPGSRNRWAAPKRQRPLTQSQIEFAQRFGQPGGPMFPWKTYLGPLPNQGTVLSLQYGGMPSNRNEANGATPPPMPNPYAPLPSSLYCNPNGPGVQATPYGEPQYPASAAGTATPGAGLPDGPGVAVIVGGLLLLAAVAFGGEKTKQYRARRKKAA